MQEGYALNAFAAAALVVTVSALAALRRTRRLVPVRLRRGIITTSAAVAARAF
jgi:hypothetical protein